METEGYCYANFSIDALLCFPFFLLHRPSLSLLPTLGCSWLCRLDSLGAIGHHTRLFALARCRLRPFASLFSTMRLS